MSSWTAPVLVVFFFSFTEACMRVNPVDPGIPAVPLCKQCATLKITPEGAPNTDGWKAFTINDPDESGACSKTKLVCSGKMASIAVGQSTVIDNTPPDTDPTLMVLAIELTCRTDGSGWDFTFDGTTLAVPETYCAVDP